MFGYPWLRLNAELSPEQSWPWGLTLALLTGPFGLWQASRKIKSGARFGIARVVYVWLGMSWVLLCLSILWEPIYWLFPQNHQPAALALVACLMLLVVFAVFNANRFQIKSLRLSSHKISAPIRIAQISDVHVGSRSSSFLQRVVNEVLRLNADVVFITGDLIDGRNISKAELAALGALAPQCFFAIGNHERYIDCADICSRLSELGLHVLRDSAAHLNVNGNNLTIIGIDDADDSQQIARTLPNIEYRSKNYTILLYHRPDGLEDASAGDVDLMLAGHTHNGQLMPFNFLVKRRFPRICGLYQHLHTALYVSVGTGTWGPPMRLGSVNEITLIELIPA